MNPIELIEYAEHGTTALVTGVYSGHRNFGRAAGQWRQS
jgi:hypothetical protein